ncbi:DUF4352 domain-containing protein [Hamadaea tsunoensis]|uniref:DUF4352 domain-containing protein n=1 Tax=Hamadaea tsunoensis TaxID=53368 RepID=UPI0004078F8F|nr:DUF4352 domain-containing protein [Hamadaea tsunoensis]
MRVRLLVAGLLLAFLAPARAYAADPGLGDAITLTGDVEGDVVTVTPLKVANPAAAADDFSGPDAGHKLVGVQFRLQNAGTVTYSDSPDNCATLVDTDGQRFHPTIADIAAGPTFPGSVTMSPGGSALGWIVFEVPSSARPASVQFTPDSGFADDTGEWTLPAGNTAANPPAAASPAAVVTAYVDAINSGDYQRAWALGGSSFDSDEGHFAAGFATTRHDTLTIDGTSGGTVRVTLDAEQTDGSHQVYEGYYTVQGGVIVGGSLERTR